MFKIFFVTVDDLLFISIENNSHCKTVCKMFKVLDLLFSNMVLNGNIHNNCLIHKLANKHPG